MASSKKCPVWIKEIQKVTAEKRILPRGQKTRKYVQCP
jgi:hypothetical protein